MKNELDKIYKKCQKDNWEEIGNKKISKKTILTAKKILSFFNPSTVDPTVDGGIEFNWNPCDYMKSVRVFENEVFFCKLKIDDLEDKLSFKISLDI